MTFFFIADPHNKYAVEAQKKAFLLYGETPLDKADVIVVLGGDGSMLRALHTHKKNQKPFYGMNLGTVGFLMNTYQADGLRRRVSQSQKTSVMPLKITAKTLEGHTITRDAFNEVSIHRQHHGATHLRVELMGDICIPELVGDGVLVATPAGSTAYNRSCGGPIIPLDSSLLALTPLSPFRPRGWRGALIPQHYPLRIHVLDPEKRPAYATADFHEIPRIKSVDIQACPETPSTLLFDPGHALEERILKEQFMVG